MSKLVILLLQYCPGSSLLEAWSSTMALSSISDCLRQCFAGVLELRTWSGGASSRATEGSKARTKTVVYMSITQCTFGQDSSQIPHQTLTAPTKALLSVKRCQIFVRGGAQARVNLSSYSADIVLSPVCIFMSTLIKVLYYHAVLSVSLTMRALVFLIFYSLGPSTVSGTQELKHLLSKQMGELSLRWY